MPDGFRWVFHHAWSRFVQGPERLRNDAVRQRGQYVEFRGSRISSQDQYYRLRTGRYGDYHIEAFYRDIPHTLSTTAYPLWNGTGFPRVFYLKYHLYAQYFPLWALGIYRRAHA